MKNGNKIWITGEIRKIRIVYFTVKKNKSWYH